MLVSTFCISALSIPSILTPRYWVGYRVHASPVNTGNTVYHQYSQPQIFSITSISFNTINFVTPQYLVSYITTSIITPTVPPVSSPCNTRLFRVWRGLCCTVLMYTGGIRYWILGSHEVGHREMRRLQYYFDILHTYREIFRYDHCRCSKDVRFTWFAHLPNECGLLRTVASAQYWIHCPVCGIRPRAWVIAQDPRQSLARSGGRALATAETPSVPPAGARLKVVVAENHRMFT